MLKRAQELNRISNIIIEKSIEVHRELGPGLLESTYEACLAYEISNEGLKIEQQKPIPVIYKNVKLDVGYRTDLIVEDCIIVELKAVEKLMPIHEAQLISYLKLADFNLGLLINFNVKLLKNGIKRIVNNFPDEP